ncbi:MAG: ATP synthase F1 subunit gamma [Oscillospiraceae bacterium]|nr:ATP synthase F1 subunit gamma [Oscillospiraceae bacterium]MBR5362109.1 ATP synthase F1 subunit gamma [Oscillospiraceae bacterium]
MAASNMKAIKRRIKSVESTMQITKAMELVSSSKLRKAKERSEQAVPFFNLLYQTMSEVASEAVGFHSVYTEEREEGAVLLIVMAGDRGLAGGFNLNVFRLADKRIRELNTMGREAVLMTVGKKSSEHYSKTTNRVLGTFDNIGETVTTYTALHMAQHIVHLFQQGHLSGVEIFFTNMVSPLSQEARQMQVIPVPNLERNPGVQSLTNYEPSPEAVFDSLIPQYLAGMLYCTIVDTYASEQAARRMAMENATDNAQEMIDDLSLKYNRARQASITQELTEIVSGANAQG